MNKGILFTAIFMALVTVVVIRITNESTPEASAAISHEQAGHDHEDEHGEPSDGHDDHGKHGGAEVNAEVRHEDHVRHDHEEGPSTHEGHDHGDHGGEGDICPEHGVPEEEDALCHGDRLGELQPGEGLMVRLASPEVAGRAGIGVIKPQTLALVNGVEIPARVVFNREKLSRITSLFAGVVQEVRVQPGAKVSKGDILAAVSVPEMASLQGEFLAAQARLQQVEAAYLREKDLLARGISSRQEFQQADADFRAAKSSTEQYRQQLLNFGFSPADIQHLSRHGLSSLILYLRAAFDGTVVEVETAVGEVVDQGVPLFTLADLDPLWVELSVPESRIFQARVDAPIQAEFTGFPDMVFSGRIFQEGAVVDERTRTLRSLAEVSNPENLLKVGMFGMARILEGTEQQFLAVPVAALQGIDGASYVFVRQGEDLFEIRRVQTGRATEGLVTVLAGLSPGEQVVSSQGFALKSEVLKARLGASCADH